MTRCSITFAGLLLIILMSSAEISGAETQRPNIVFFFTDDLTTQAISAYGEKRKLLETPNIDRLAKEGMTFDDLVKWGDETGNIPDARSIASFDEIPKAVAVRLLRAVKGLILQIKANGGAK